MGIILLVLYTFLQLIIGRLLFLTLFGRVSRLFDLEGSFLLGVFVSVPVTYILSCIFSFTGEPLLGGMVSFIAISIGVTGYWLRVGRKTINNKQNALSAYRPLSDFLLLVFSLAFSTWIMTKTFRAGTDGQLFVGSNNVFDFGLFIGLVRSMAWGGNIPLMSPFFAGQPLFYHFFFQFWVSLWEYSGIPTVWAVNIPSILSFSALLITIYYLPQIVLRKGKLVGWIAVVLTITHSTLTFWHIIIEKGANIKILFDIWRLPTYPFAGPFDGSVISLYTTLNSYVNQRHLAFASAIGILLYMLVVIRLEQEQLTKRISVCIGFLTGLLFMWNIAICILAGVLISILLALHRLWQTLLFFLLGSAIFILISLVPYMPYFFKTFITVNRMVAGTFNTIGTSLPTWTLMQYLWENLGILPIIILFGFIVLSKKGKLFLVPFLLFFVIECLLAGFGKRGFDQKFYSFLIIGVNVIAAVGISWLLGRRTLVFRGSVLGILFILCISGVIDLIAIKNEFAYPFISKEMIPVISWIQHQTPKDSVFISYADMIDPVVLAGRRNYFGFFGNVGWTDRSPIVKNIYAGDIKTAKQLGISYILTPKWNKNDFPYTVDTMYFQEHRMMVYEDERYTIFSVRD